MNCWNVSLQVANVAPFRYRKSTAVLEPTTWSCVPLMSKTKNGIAAAANRFTVSG
jgi:hypothetical protein